MSSLRANYGSSRKLFKVFATLQGLATFAQSKGFLICVMVMCKLDQVMLLYFSEGVLSGIACLHLHDILCASSADFENNVIANTKEKFQIGSNETKSFF